MWTDKKKVIEDLKYKINNLTSCILQDIEHCLPDIRDINHLEEMKKQIELLESTTETTVT